ncbi:MAG: ammonia-forming cytochrome c nitrite reductase subunit c552 [Nitrospirae bacterium]|nr:ammonia-forming cytochrome c nitrite reductase subunit c552 [Nitrospirota bacterium]
MKSQELILVVGLILTSGIVLGGCKTEEVVAPTLPSPTSTTTPVPKAPMSAAVSQLKCLSCHADVHAKWKGSPHAKTQADPAGELGEERAGQTPEEVIHGEDAEDCIACHAPTAVLANGGMNEVQALEYFFTTEDGKFTKDTVPVHSSEWPNVACIVCHKVPDNHPTTIPTRALFNSQTGKYASVDSVSELCGQCHGNLRFPDTDHRTYNAWTTSKHAKTQADPAGELGEERAGQTPEEVIHGEDAENCIACHAPTAVLANGGMSEVQALEYFFTTEDGKFTKDTAPVHSSEWPNVACIACHDQHNPGEPAYFNSSTKKHEPMKNTSELCGQCHGSLRFPDTDHLSYNIRTGTGGIGVPDQRTMPGATCTDCHMFVSKVDDSNSATFHGHTWAITVQEADGKSTTSCTRCHAGSKDAAKAKAIISAYKSGFQALDVTAQKNVAAAAEAMKGIQDKVLQAKLKEARHNLTYAESDESGGFHNHKYLMALVKDANDKAREILSTLGK